MYIVEGPPWPMATLLLWLSLQRRVYREIGAPWGVSTRSSSDGTFNPKLCDVRTGGSTLSFRLKTCESPSGNSTRYHCGRTLLDCRHFRSSPEIPAFVLLAFTRQPTLLKPTFILLSTHSGFLNPRRHLLQAAQYYYMQPILGCCVRLERK